MVAAGSITVAVRVRPPTQWEAARLPEPCYDTTMRGDGALSTPGRSVTSTAPLRDIVQIVDDRILTFDPDEKDKARAFVERGFMPPGTKRYKDKRFMFDRVFDHEARQQDVYAATSQPLLKGLLDGYNATVFAYGATGCGKTHTISGTEADPGIIYLTMADLFQRIADRRDEWNVEVMVTFLEIYNEEIRDLLAEPGAPVPRGGLSIREDKSVKVVGLVELRPNSAEEVKEIVLQGNGRRMQSPTHANETSSRSHAVLQVHVSQSPRTASVTEQRTMATLSIIDLAGSERAAATTNMGQRMVEGANINKSLLALGNCINALCESGGAVRHVPYRNSKLTRLLKFSLGGNCKTVMIVCVAPTSNHFDDTHNTLVYAERATKIKSKVVTRNVVNVDRHVGRYVEAINRLNTEVAELKAKLAGKATAENAIVQRKKQEAQAEVERSKSDMQTKVEQTQPSIVDGASCAGKISAANAKLRAIHARLAVIDSLAASAPLPPDLEAERGLLRALAGPEEQVVRSDSALNVRLQRSMNSGHMFDATLRAVSERRSDRLDEVSVDNVKMDARWRRAEMERIKAEAERDAVQAVIEAQADMVVNLVGMVGRCTVMMGEAGRMLRCALEEGRDGMEGTVRAMAASLKTVAEQNDESFKQLVGHETSEYASEEKMALENFKGHTTTFRRAPGLSASVAGRPSIAQAPPARRASSYGSGGPSGSPQRRTYRTPRKSLRSSLTSQPYRRVSDKEKGKGKEKEKEKKSVQWRDEAGQGEIDDAGILGAAPATAPESQPAPTPTIAVTLVDGASTSTSTLPERSPSRSSVSMGGSESDWEDDKTDDSVNMSFQAGPSNPGPKRPRASRLDPSFLKGKTRGGGTALGSLAECDENGTPVKKGATPLGDRSMNRLPELHVPKRSEKHGLGSPARRVPAAHGAGKGRRRSNIGPMRNEKGRRRSSLIPQPSPPSANGRRDEDHIGARRVPINSPAKRSRRVSLLGKGSLRASKPSNNSFLANLSAADPNASGDLSFRAGGGSRPTWK
ncbi:hypothetical protein PLICRDRAFT_693946 [Plicaturopsis crispa FD-325 SS-3]|nr:hypothetical protein PLICRDRAFT_693946 [Plicaturopsis crispa FD-325 SS-3]